MVTPVKHLLFLLLCGISFWQMAWGNQPVFLQNQGQWPETTHFRALNGNLQADFGPHSVEWVLQNSEGITAYSSTFTGANRESKPQGRKLNPTSFHFINQDNNHSSQGFAEIVYTDLYAGIDALYYYEKGKLKYDLRVQAGADPANIKIAYEGVDCLEITEDGSLLVHTPRGTFSESAPYSYQIQNGTHTAIPSSYLLDELGNLSFEFPKGYDSSLPLVIDPVYLNWSTFVGGALPGLVGGLGNFVLDEDGFIYAVGTHQVGGFPASSGSYDPNGTMWDDIVVFKMDPKGENLIWATYIGGSKWEKGVDVARDANGDVIVVGSTTSDDYPVTAGVFQPVSADLGLGNNEIVISKLSGDGARLIWSSYYGGLGGDYPRAIAIGSDGDPYVGGYTVSGNIPTTSGAFDETFNGAQGFADAFVFRMESDGSQLVYSTFIGGNESESVHELLLNDRDEACFTGEVSSWNFPVTPNAVFPTKVSLSAEAFVARLSADGSQLLMSTYIPGERGEQGEAFAINQAGDCYVAGRTYSSYFPLTAGALDSTKDGMIEIFLSRISEDGTQLQYSTYLGGNAYDYATDLKVNNRNEIFICGNLTSYDLYTTPCTFDSTNDGGGNNFGGDAFLMKISPDGQKIMYSTYLGGGGPEQFGRIELKDNACTQEVIWAVSTGSGDYPTTPNSFQSRVETGNSAMGFTSLRETLDIEILLPPNPCPKPGESIQFSHSEAACGSWSDLSLLEWHFGDGTVVLDSFPTHSYAANGSYDIELYLPGCSEPLDQVRLELRGLDLGEDRKICPGERVQLDASVPGNNQYLWQDGIAEAQREAEEPGLYRVEVLTEAGCTLSDSVVIALLDPASIRPPNVMTPNFDNVNDAFFVEGIESGRWKLWIYDRWGNLLYENMDYSNDWEGGDLPEGVYYYVLQGPGPCGRFQGSFTLLR